MKVSELLDLYCGNPMTIEVYFWVYKRLNSYSSYPGKVFTVKEFKKPKIRDWPETIGEIKKKFGDCEIEHWNLCHGTKKNGKIAKSKNKAILTIRLKNESIRKLEAID